MNNTKKNGMARISLNRVVAVLLLVVVFALALLLTAVQAAQETISAEGSTGTLVQLDELNLSGRNISSFSSLSDQQLEALFRVLDATPTIPATNLPTAGTFWSLSHVDQPPLPGDVPGASAWLLQDGSFLLDDENMTNTAVSEASTESILTTLTADSSSPPSPGSGSSTNGYSANTNVLLGAKMFNTNLLWLQVTNCINGTAYANLMNPTDSYYGIWSTTNVLTPFALWSIETEVIPTQTNRMPFTVATSGRQNLFLRAEDWTGIYSNGLPVWWTWYYFHTLDLSWTNQDAYGDTLGDDYTNQTDPDTIIFDVAVTNSYVNTANPNLPLEVTWGTPAYVAILVNDTTFTDAVWLPYTNSDVVANLKADGNYEILVGLRGFPTNATESWEELDLVKNTVLPRLTITTPAGGTVSNSPIEFQGFANGALNTVTYDIQNSSGTFSDNPASLTGQYYNTTLNSYTTNYFQSEAIYLASGTNIITLHATDWAGNQTNISLTLNYPVAAPNFSLIWPPSGTVVGNPKLTVQARINSPGGTASGMVGTTPVQGVVEQNGTVWVQNLHLVSGTNSVTITATNMNGIIATTNLTIVETNIGLVVQPLAPENETYVPVNGTIGNTNLAIYVNGILAVVHLDKTWEVLDTQMNPLGTAVICVVVSNKTGLVASQNFYQPQPPMVTLMSYSGHQNTIDTTPVPYNSGTYSDSVDWFYNTGGYWVDSIGNDEELSAATNGAGFVIDAPWNTATFDNLPWENAAISVLITNDFEIFQSSTETRTMISQSGMQQAGITNLYFVMARACEFSETNIQDGLPGYGVSYGALSIRPYNNINSNLPYGGDVGLPPEWLQINGQPLGNTGITNILSSSSGGASIGSVWGAAVIAAPSGVDWPLTLTATNVYHNRDYTFDMNVYPMQMQILDGNGDDLTSQTSVVIVGQQLDLTCNVIFNNSGFTNTVTVSNYLWTVPGFALTNFYVSKDVSQSNGYPALLSVTNIQRVSYFWADGATNRTIQCTAMINGATVTGEAVFDVEEPTAKITASTSAVTLVGTNANYNEAVRFGSNTTPGISFSKNISIPSGFSGITEWVQIDYASVRSLQETNGLWHVETRTGLSPWLDTSYPYTNSASTVDSPSSTLYFGPDHFSTVVASDQFTMWLMFQPAGGQWVPLRAVNWAWGGCITNSPYGWGLQYGTNTVNPADFSTTVYPEWQSNVTNEAFIPPL